MSMDNYKAFALGLIVGAGGTYLYFKYKLEREEFIEEPDESFTDRDEVETLHAISERSVNKPDILSYSEHVEKLGYGKYHRASEKQNKEEEKDDEETMTNPVITQEPYVISPAEAGMMEDYDLISLTYYDDGIVANDNDEIVEDIGGTIGFDSLSTFGRYEPDSVYVRNDEKKCEYEIVKDVRTYAEVVNGKVYR